MRKKQVADANNTLLNLVYDSHVELDYSNAFELLIASILAAQNRDTTIKEITAILFRKYRTPQIYVNAPAEQLEIDITKAMVYLI